MTAQWQRLSTPTSIHYYDPALANAWLDRAIALTNAASEAAGSAATPTQQAGLARAAWQALGYAYQALDLRPGTEQLYLGQMRGAYGAHFNAGDATVTLSGNPGTIAQAALRIFTAVHPLNASVVGLWTPVRLQLGPDAAPSAYCLTPSVDGSGCPRSFPNRSNYDGSSCAYGGDDWRCGGWDDVVFQPSAALAPLIYSFRLAGTLAAAARARGVDAIVQTAMASGASNLSGGANAPTQDVPDPPGFVRPTTTTVRGLGTHIDAGTVLAATAAAAPRVTLAAPAPGAALPAYAPATLTAQWDAGADVARVEFFLNGASVGQAIPSVAPALTPAQRLLGLHATAPTSASLATAALAPGAYAATARATGASGLVGPNAPTLNFVVQTLVPVVPPSSGGGGTAPACALPDAPFTTQAQVDAWNAANPSCPPVALPVPIDTTPAAVSCDLPPAVVSAPVAPGASYYQYDPYFASSAARDAWITAHPGCPAPPPFQPTVLVPALHVDGVPGTLPTPVPPSLAPPGTTAPPTIPSIVGAPAAPSAGALVAGAAVVAGLGLLAYLARPAPASAAPRAPTRTRSRRSAA